MSGSVLAHLLGSLGYSRPRPVCAVCVRALFDVGEWATNDMTTAAWGLVGGSHLSIQWELAKH